jgi:hypothetical protein
MVVSRRWSALLWLALAACEPADEAGLDDGTGSIDGIEPDAAPIVPSCSPRADGPSADVDNLAKYWAYRARLRERFVWVSPGDEPGTNLPVSVIWQDGLISWGDTTIQLGQYFSMLATEHELLVDRQPEAAARTGRELVYALRALDRLDRVGEAHFRWDHSEHEGDVNGFFIRDDVPPDVLEQHPIPGATYVGSGITDPYGVDEGHGATEMSQDQVWHLLVGLALIKRFGDHTIDVDGTPVHLRSYAKELTNRILRYMRDHDRWKTENPVTGDYVLRGAEWDARRVFSYGFARAGNWILGQDAPGDPGYGDLHNTASKLAQPFFRLAKAIEVDNYNQRALATVGDINYAVFDFAFGSCRWKLEHEVLSRTKFRYEQFPLIHVLLHGGSTRLDPELYGGYLNAAPPEGPWNYGGDGESCDWSSSSRLIWPEGTNDYPDAWEFGEYNGVDYLLLHNLYQLVYNQANLDALYAAPAAGSMTQE